MSVLANLKQIHQATSMAFSQLAALEWLIWHSNDAALFTKKCLIWLLRRSLESSREVLVELRAVTADESQVAHELLNGIESMKSDHKTTHLVRLFQAVGLEYFPHCMAGGYNPVPAGHFSDSVPAVTLWISKVPYISKNGGFQGLQEIPFKLEEIESIKLLQE